MSFNATAFALALSSAVYDGMAHHGIAPDMQPVIVFNRDSGDVLHVREVVFTAGHVTVEVD